jgi:hypothetical protein
MQERHEAQIIKRFTPVTAASFIVLGCILVAAAANSGSGRPPARDGPHQPAAPVLMLRCFSLAPNGAFTTQPRATLWGKYVSQPRKRPTMIHLAPVAGLVRFKLY